MDEIEVPQYFICPISLQIMKDPVTAITGITYDRDSIEHWLFTNKNTTCPVTKQPLPLDSDLTPNHTLRRLIQSWCTQNASLGIDRIPTPKPPLTKTQVQKLLKGIKDPKIQLKSLMQLELLAAEKASNRKILLENGVPKAMIMFIVDCYKNGEIYEGIEEALGFLQFVKVPTEEVKNLLFENNQILDSLTWILVSEMKNSVTVKSHAVLVLKKFINKCDSTVLERLKPEFFERIVKVLRNGVITQQGLSSALHIFLYCCPLGRNRLMMVEAGAIYELIEIELMAIHEKRITELTFGILFHLCSCANGRFQFLSHQGSIAVLTERLFKVSMTVDDRAVFILSLISKFSATKMVLDEMLKVGTVAKLFVLLQTDHAKYLKDKVMEIFKAHSEVWKNSPCFPQTSLYAR
ncbi:putative aminoacyltransferase, E1 ubiquitin-activating enzyme [Medicago truncatula]|uniref:U-box domain-containing protein n=1 Tax=Medicago truncatula TaxID=3880 RepID=A0A072VUZ2_MEDTR|nr:E3 ubiquitin-protein ligase PUB24 [Medicago truncatula]KEH41885.1 E3 ubiquitin-protein ligase PUB23-like protein [Medicago truncatula]RHN79434.1 putative aminoacyltransferase, E1 ubiquitin-activating enzyme [Medicago truncatula]